MKRSILIFVSVLLLLVYFREFVLRSVTFSESLYLITLGVCMCPY